MIEFFQPTQSRVRNAPSTSSSKSYTTTPISLNGSLKPQILNENKISAPSGREIINTSGRRNRYIGRSGAGNVMPLESSPEKIQRSRELMEREQQVLKSYKAQTINNHTTGRGGAGAKGHVQIKGKVPNRERALAKERDIQARWREERERTGALKTGRGGRGNIKKVVLVADDASSTTTQARAESRVIDWTRQRSLFPFGATSPDQMRRRSYSFNRDMLSSKPGSSSFDYGSMAREFSRVGSSAADYWETVSDHESLSDKEDAPGIVTSTIDPLKLGSLVNPGKITAAATTKVTGAKRTPNPAAPFEEPGTPLPRTKLSVQINPIIPRDHGSLISPTSPSQLLQPLKKLHFGKTYEMRDRPTSMIVDISAASCTTYPHIEPPPPISISTSTTVSQFRSEASAASTALRMVDPSSRNFMPPIVPPPPQPIKALSAFDEDDIIYDISRTSSTTSGNTDSISSSVHPLPPKLPVLYFQVQVPPRGNDIRWSKRPLPMPPPIHRVLRRNSNSSGLPSPPETPLDVEFVEELTPTISPSHLLHF